MILSWSPCRGCTGTTPPGCTAPLTTSPLSSTKPRTTVRTTPDSSRCRENPPSTKPGAVHSLSHLPQQTLLTEQLNTLLPSLRDQRLSLLLTDQPRLISIPARPSHPASVQHLLHYASSPSNRIHGPAWRSRAYTSHLTRPHAMVWEPASNTCRVSSRRSLNINTAVAAEIAH